MQAETVRRIAMLARFARFVTTAALRIDARRGVDIAALRQVSAGMRVGECVRVGV